MRPVRHVSFEQQPRPPSPDYAPPLRRYLSDESLPLSERSGPTEDSMLDDNGSIYPLDEEGDVYELERQNSYTPSLPPSAYSEGSRTPSDVSSLTPSERLNLTPTPPSSDDERRRMSADYIVPPQASYSTAFDPMPLREGARFDIEAQDPPQIDPPLATRSIMYPPETLRVLRSPQTLREQSQRGNILALIGTVCSLVGGSAVASFGSLVPYPQKLALIVGGLVLSGVGLLISRWVSRRYGPQPEPASE